MKNDRLFQILYLLLEKGSITAPQLAETLEVSVRTVYRDIEALSMAGVPVYTTPGRGGGIGLLPDYAINKALLTDQEQNQLLFAIQSLQATDQQVSGLISKLGGLFRKQNANWIEVDFSRWGFARVDQERFEQLKTAILERRVLSILYCSTSGDLTEREVQPFKLIFKDKGWYLQAFCLKAEDYRLFKISRIVSLTLTDTHFDATFDDAPPIETPVGPPGQMIRAKLWFSPAVAYRVYDEFNPACVQKQPDGSMLVTAEFPPGEWIISYLLSFGGQVKVLAPQELRLQLAAQAKMLYEHHKS